MAGDAAIWFVESGAANATEAAAAAADKIEFNQTPVTTKEGLLKETSFRVVRSDIDMEVAFGDLNDYQDTGPKRVIATLAGIIEQPRQATHQIRTNLKTFSLRDSQSTNYPKGKVGIRVNGWDEFDTVPTANRGWNVISIEAAASYEFKNKVAFVCELIFGANKTGVNAAGNFAWS